MNVLNIEVMCRIADGALRPGELVVTQRVAPLVSWCVSTRVSSPAGALGDVTVELHLPDDTVWTGEVYPVVDGELDREEPGESPEHQFPFKAQLRGTGPLRENSIPIHADVVVKRLEDAARASARTT
ncbi:MAG TPA: hypothetical protein VN748_04410 [Pseudonocardiaceae bacterium]|jgi:hypothetical protein|nr:hypothetical protein [Pseudonocardiaceae bacterium]